jgi:hypothetical protein
VKKFALPLFLCAFVFLSAFLAGETITLPAVTSLPVGAAASPFFSDVRVFNTSYVSSVSVTAVYRCFLGACPAAAPQVSFALAPRESRAFDDMVFGAFNAPSSAGAVEFTSSGTEIRVTSRLYSTAPIPTVGMFIPGLRASEAHTTAVLTSLSNGAFRTNIGLYNGNDVGAVATIKLFNGNGTALLGVQTVPLAPRSGTQINRIFDAVGQGGVSTTNAYAVVESSGAPLFTYAAVIDNTTTDPIFVTGADDQRGPSGPVVTATPPPPAATPTPTPTQAITVTLTAQTFRWSFNGGGTTFTMHVGQTYEVHMRSLDVTHGFPGLPELGMAQQALFSGAGEIIQIVQPTAAQIGTHVFACDIECGVGHGFQGSISVAQ